MWAQLEGIVLGQLPGVCVEAELRGLVVGADMRDKDEAVRRVEQDTMGLLTRVDVLYELADGAVVSDAVYRDPAAGVVAADEKTAIEIGDGKCRGSQPGVDAVDVRQSTRVGVEVVAGQLRGHDLGTVDDAGGPVQMQRADRPMGLAGGAQLEGPGVKVHGIRLDLLVAGDGDEDETTGNLSHCCALSREC